VTGTRRTLLSAACHCKSHAQTLALKTAAELLKGSAVNEPPTLSKTVRRGSAQSRPSLDLWRQKPPG
jgi:hypothetical protein